MRFGRMSPAEAAAARADLGALSVTAMSLSVNGYLRLSNGFILQWGRNTGSGASRSVLYPVSFPSDCFAPVATIYNGVSSETTAESVHIGTFDVNGFFAYPRFSYANSGVNWAGEPFSWVALGW